MAELGPDQWQRMWQVFEEALALPEAERSKFVAEACDGDPLMRQTVENLLASDAVETGLLDRPVIERAAETTDHVPGAEVPNRFEVAPSQPEPRRAGPYRLLRRIGQGGMGTVFLAKRDDESFQRRVVVKLVRHGMESPDIERRLRVERQILASLDHPYIARLYDGGTTDDGKPYFVMEYVEGVPIDEFCDVNRLSVGQRLDLFRKVLAAVGYAHQNLVVHRDLKPSNILVTSEGEPKLLDFGIAKLLNAELLSAEVEPTATWHRMLTPHYASPEQIRGKLVTTVSDVYSLGVLLYSLLCGDLPHRFQDSSPLEIERILTGTVPKRPSVRLEDPGDPSRGAGGDKVAAQRRTTPRQLQRRLRGDLDSIVLKALRSSPQERYSSVEQLAADIERHQTGLAVSARRGTWRYRAGKLVRRHRALTAAVASILALSVAFGGAMSWKSAQVAQERDQARLEKKKAANVLRLMLDIVGVRDPTISQKDKGEMTVTEALDRSSELFDVRLRGHPDLRAEVQEAIATVYWHVGEHERARGLLGEALDVRQGLYGEGSREAAETSIALSHVLRDDGELERAESLARRAVADLRHLALPDARPLVQGLNALVAVLCQKGDNGTAEPLARETLELARGLPGFEEELAFAFNSLASIRAAEGDDLGASQYYRQSLALLNSLWGEEHPELLKTLNNFSLSLRQAGELEEAVEIYQRTLQVKRRTLTADHPALASTTNNLAGALFALGRYGEAETFYREALRVLEINFGPGHGNNFLVLVRLQATRLRLGHAAEAERELRRLIDEWRPILEGDWALALATSVLGEAVAAQERYDEAEPLLVESFHELLESSRYRRRKEGFDRLAAFYELVGRPEEIPAYRAQLGES